MNTIFSVIGIILLLFTCGCSIFSGGGYDNTISYIVPLYSYPVGYYSNEWNKLYNFDSKGKKVDVIINVSSGPGNSRDPNFEYAISKLSMKNFRVIGYVYSSYGSRQISEVKSDIDKWFSIYGDQSIDGIFIDEVSVDNLDYYSNLFHYIKQNYGNQVVVILNPGMNVSKSYFSIADKVIVFESPYDKFTSFVYSDYQGIDSSRVCTIVYNIDTKSSLDEVKNKCLSNNSSCLYLYDGNTYFTISKYVINLDF